MAIPDLVPLAILSDLVYKIPMAVPAAPETAIRRTTLRSETQAAVRARIVDGRLGPGANVVERNLSQTLGISRTPLREALLGLEAEGLLRVEPQRGFFVAALSVEEAREIYPLIGALEALAIERGRPTVLDGLDEINQRFRAAKDQAQAVERDREWHEALIGRCGTPRMAAILQGLRTAAGRYEYRFFSGRHVIAESARQHGEIAKELRRARHGRAAMLLKSNWEEGLKWIEKGFRR
jgi:DNA-binding GntR family transcriptional regulator